MPEYTINTLGGSVKTITLKNNHSVQNLIDLFVLQLDNPDINNVRLFYMNNQLNPQDRLRTIANGENAHFNAINDNNLRGAIIQKLNKINVLLNTLNNDEQNNLRRPETATLFIRDSNPLWLRKYEQHLNDLHNLVMAIRDEQIWDDIKPSLNQIALRFQHDILVRLKDRMDRRFPTARMNRIRRSHAALGEAAGGCLGGTVACGAGMLTGGAVGGCLNGLSALGVLSGASTGLCGISFVAGITGLGFCAPAVLLQRSDNPGRRWGNNLAEHAISRRRFRL